MADSGVTAAELAAVSFEARKSSRRAGQDASVEVQVRTVRRRNWSTEDRLRIVRETLAPGAVAKVIAERHDISTGLLYTWRKEMLATAMAGFVPVQMAVEAPSGEPVAAAATGSIEVTLPSGAGIRVTGADAVMLRVVLSELAGR